MADQTRAADIVFPMLPNLPKRPDYVELGPQGFERPPAGIAGEVLDLVHRFASNVMRPQGILLDRMTAEQVVAPDSPLREIARQFDELGLGAIAELDLTPVERIDLQSMVSEELGWGDSGLAGSLGLGGICKRMALKYGRPELAKDFALPLRGCWAITEPTAGSDMLDWQRDTAHADANFGRPSVIAKLDGDKIVINGQKSAWVGDGPTADYALLNTTFDRGRGREGIALFVSLNQEGVKRGKPLEKMGMRPEPQGELYFDNVIVPIEHVLAGPDQYDDIVYDHLCAGNIWMATTFVGVARAAYEHALAYAHERKQGGVPIIRHQLVQHNLFHMMRRVEAARALARQTARFNSGPEPKSLAASIAAKVTSTQTAFDVASDAMQIFGGNSIAYEYPVEKLLRDARMSMIADGCNNMLAIKAGRLLIDPKKVQA